MARVQQLGGGRLLDDDLRDLLAALVAVVVVRNVPRFQLEAFMSILRLLLRQATS